MKNLKRFLKFILKFKSYIIFAFTFMSLSVLLSLPMPLLTKYLIDSVIETKDLRTLNIIGLFLIFVILFQSLSSYLQRFFNVKFRAKVIYNFKRILFEHIQDLEIEFFRNRETGYLLSRINSDVEALRGLLADTILSVIRNSLTFIVGVILVLWLHLKLGIIAISILPFYVLSIIIFNKRIKSLSHEVREYHAQMQKDLQETLSGIDLIKAFTAEELSSKRVSKSIKRVIDKEVKLDLTAALAGSITSVIGSIAPLILIWYGIYEIIHGRFTLGSLVAFNSFIRYLYGPANSLVNTNFGIQKALAGLDRIYEILDMPTERKSPSVLLHREGKLTEVGAVSEPIELKIKKGIIEFKNVSFGYSSRQSSLIHLHQGRNNPPDPLLQGGNYIFKNLNLRFERGINVIMGPSGSGKTTILKLLLRFYEPEKGEILIDGQNIKYVNLRSLRKNISLISQDIFLFSDTILENLRFANPSAGIKEIEFACEKAKILEFIENLPEGFNTKIGERGLKLSGGERQRLSIARAILKNTPILLMDEPTSQLDSITEKAILEFLREYKNEKTIIVVTHKEKIFQIADKIIDLEQKCNDLRYNK